MHQFAFSFRNKAWIGFLMFSFSFYSLLSFSKFFSISVPELEWLLTCWTSNSLAKWEHSLCTSVEFYVIPTPMDIQGSPYTSTLPPSWLSSFLVYLQPFLENLSLQWNAEIHNRLPWLLCLCWWGWRLVITTVVNRKRKWI